MKHTEKKKKKFYQRWWFWLLVVWVVIAVAAEYAKDGDGGSEKQPDAPPKVLEFLDDFTEYGYSVEQIDNMRTLLTNVGITEITESEIEPVVSGMQVIKGVVYQDPVYKFTGKEVRVQFNIENGKIYLVSIYCPSYGTANQPTYLSGLTDRRADLYYDVEGGYLKKIDWENKAVVDY